MIELENNLNFGFTIHSCLWGRSKKIKNTTRHACKINSNIYSEAKITNVPFVPQIYRKLSLTTVAGYCKRTSYQKYSTKTDEKIKA